MFAAVRNKMITNKIVSLAQRGPSDIYIYNLHSHICDQSAPTPFTCEDFVLHKKKSGNNAQYQTLHYIVDNAK